MPESPNSNDLFSIELAPPREPKPPSFWDAHKGTLLAGFTGWLLAIAIVIFLVTRRRATAPIPPAVRIRRELEALRNSPRDAATLGAASRLVRSFLLFELGVDHEVTTAELAGLLRSRPEIAPALADEAVHFLERCDTAKFSAARANHEDVVAEAIQIVERFASVGSPIKGTTPR